jgi:putative tryptophan/tyrosine transport system substrate-binding protein
MRRREFIALVGGAAASSLCRPVAAQQQAMPVVGFISSLEGRAERGQVAAFNRGLNELGYIEGQNVRVEYRWAQGQYDRLPALADELVRRQVTVIFASAPPAVLAVKAATSTIPIVFQMGADPVELGIVASLNRPGGNVTGITTLTDGLEAKRLEVLYQLMPNASAIDVLVNPKFPNVGRQLSDLQQGARALGVQLRILDAGIDAELATAFETLTQRQASLLLVAADPFFLSRRDQIVELAAHHALPAVYSFREYVVAGGLMSYGSSLAEAFRSARHLCRQNSQGRKTRRPSSAAVYEGRACLEHEDREVARSHVPSLASRSRRRGDRMRRRDFIGLVGGAAATWPLAAHARQQAMPVIGFLSASSPTETSIAVAFNRGLREAGFIEGKSVTVEYL